MGSPEISIYFTDGHNTGQQKMLQLITRAECEHGAQPKFEVSTANDAANKGDIKCTLTREAAYPANNVYRERATVPTVVSVTRVLAYATALTATLALDVIMSTHT